MCEDVRGRYVSFEVYGYAVVGVRSYAYVVNVLTYNLSHLSRQVVSGIKDVKHLVLLSVGL